MTRTVKVASAGAPTVDDLIGLLDHARALAPYNRELADSIFRTARWFLVHGERLVWTRDNKDAWRYLEVCHALDHGAKWDHVFAEVSEELTRIGHGAAAGEDRIRKSYQRVQAALPPEQQRPLTFRRRPLGA